MVVNPTNATCHSYVAVVDLATLYLTPAMGLARQLLSCGATVVLASLLWQWANYVDVEGKLPSLELHSLILHLLCDHWHCAGCTEFYAGKRVILTGASRGIGKTLAIRLSQLGAKYA